MIGYTCYNSPIEPKNIKEVLEDEYWLIVMQEELSQFTRNEVWDLAPCPQDANVIGTKWIFMNRLDETGNITINKAQLVVQGYTQVEGIDFDETFSPIAHLESISLLMAFACTLCFKLY